MFQNNSNTTCTIKSLDALTNKIPKWNLSSLHERNCPICNKEGMPLFHRADKLIIKICSNCNCAYISPSPSESDLITFYTHYEKLHKKTQDRTSGSVVTNPLLDFRNRVIKAHINNPKGAKILDIGFGMCSNLRNLKAMGFEVFGLDPDSEACEMAKKEFGNDSIYSGTLDNSKLEIADFDLITLYDVIEHPLSPMTLMKNALSRLKKDGLLAIFTPNMPDIKSNKLVQFQIDLEHLQYLTPQTIAFIAKEFNLNIIHLECSGFPVIPDIHNNGIKLKKSIIHAAKGFVRNLPFFIRFNRIRHQLFNSIPDNRLGNYNIFAILQKQ